MSNWAEFWWLFGQAAEGMVALWPVTAVLLGGVLFGVWRLFAASESRRVGGWFLQLAPLCLPLFILAVGTAFRCENCSRGSAVAGTPHIWAEYGVEVLLVFQLVGAIWLVWKATGARLLSVSLQGLILWCSFWAAFMAGMSISGDWL